VPPCNVKVLRQVGTPPRLLRKGQHAIFQGRYLAKYQEGGAMPLVPRKNSLINDVADRLERYASVASPMLERDSRKIESLRKLAVALDRRKLLALRLELPGEVWDDAIKPILDALQP
jgi:hypothetical protein